MLENETKILKDFIAKAVKRLEDGGTAYVTGNYCTYNYVDSVLDKYHQKLVNKLHSLGYESTTNHGFGCKDWAFMKKIEL